MNNEKTALVLLDKAVASMPLNRQDHQQLAAAINALDAALRELEQLRAQKKEKPDA